MLRKLLHINSSPLHQVWNQVLNNHEFGTICYTLRNKVWDQIHDRVQRQVGYLINRQIREQAKDA